MQSAAGAEGRRDDTMTRRRAIAPLDTSRKEAAVIIVRLVVPASCVSCRLVVSSARRPVSIAAARGGGDFTVSPYSI